MNRDEARAAFLEALVAVAPEVDPQTLDPGESLREQVDLDSMDVRRLVQRLEERLGIPIPEGEHHALDTLDSAVEWLVGQGVG